MKQIVYFAFILSAVLLTSCNKRCDCTLKTNRVLLLKVDYLTYQFEGGFEQVISSPFAPFDTLPITETFKAPGDFGNISFHYQPNNDLIFDGDIVWNGWGPINYPAAFDTATSFLRLPNAMPLPDSTQFQRLTQYAAFKQPLDSIWMDIADLKVVKDYSAGNKTIGYFLYTPSVGFGNPADWDWIVVLNASL